MVIKQVKVVEIKKNTGNDVNNVLRKVNFQFDSIPIDIFQIATSSDLLVHRYIYRLTVCHSLLWFILGKFMI